MTASSFTHNINAPETVYVTHHHVACDGGDVSGHPITYYVIPTGQNSVECRYCDRRFVLQDDHHE